MPQEQFDDRGMTREFVVPWNRVSVRYPDAAKRVRGIRTNPNMRKAKLWAQMAPDGYLEVNPDLAGRADIDSVFAHELEHARGGNEATAKATERAHTQGQSADPVAQILLRAPAVDAVRAQAWDAYAQATDANDLAARLQPLKLPDAIKADLWDLKARAAPVVPPRAPGLATIGEQAQAKPEGSATRRFLSNAGAMVNPVAIAKGLYQAGRHPRQTYDAMVDASAEQFAKAGTAFHEGRYVEAAGHAGAGALPVIGPAAAAAGEQIASGDVAGGLGTGAGMLALSGAPRIVQGVRRAASALPERVPVALESGAARRVADVMSPKVGANKTRFANRADEVAPQLAQDLGAEGAPLTRQGFHRNVKVKLAEAEAALDAATDARLSARTFKTKPILDALKAKRREFTAEAVEGSRVVRSVDAAGTPPRPKATGYEESLTKPSFDKPSFDKPMASPQVWQAVPIGKDVVPGPHAARVAVLDQAIAEIEALGPVARYEPIKRIRQAYDGPAKAVYSPSMTQDFLKQQGGAFGAADVTAALRSELAKWDPHTATANAQYSLYRASDDVLRATAEVERARPKVGRQIIARMTGSILGFQQGGAAGAVTGYVAGPIVDSALASGLTSQLKTAALMQRLATAIRKGDVGYVNSLTAQIKRLGSTGASVIGNATSPSEPRRHAVPAMSHP